MSNTISNDLLEILACPKCRAAIRQTGDCLECVNPDCALRYPVRDGIPIMLIDEAQPPAQGRKPADRAESGAAGA